MAGHNKWSKIKRQKAATDAKRSRVWARLSRELTVAAREGGGDPDLNAKLALAVDRAKAENMPKDNIERAIGKGTGEIEGADYEEVVYEGYGPGGVAVFVEALTDNTNRTVADLRLRFGKAGGGLGKAGTVAYLFDRKGVIEVAADAVDELTLFDVVAEAGAEDLRRDDDAFLVTTPVEAFDPVRSALDDAGVDVREAALERFPTTTVTPPPGDARRVVDLVEQIEALEDVQAVYTTLDEAALDEGMLDEDAERIQPDTPEA